MNDTTSLLTDSIVGLVKGLGGKLKEFCFQPMSPVNVPYILAQCHEELKEVETLDIHVVDDPTQVIQAIDILKAMVSLRKLRFLLMSADKSRDARMIDLSLFKDLT